MSKALILLFNLTILLQFSCFGQNISKNDKIKVAESLITLLQDNYVLQDSVKLIIPKLRQLYSSEEFSIVQSEQEFGLYMTSKLREITKDAHFAFLHNPQLSHLLSNPDNGNREELNMQLNTLGGGSAVPSSKRNYYLKRVEILDGNIGYLKLEQMTSLADSKATLDAAMFFLSNSDAFILDLRGNRGGVGGFIPYLMSYFFPKEKTLLYTREMPAPAWDSISYHYTHEEIPGKRFENVPTYILTDKITGSAATNLAYTMQSFQKAIIVGENTGSGYRGAHSGSLFSLPKGMVAIIPFGKVINARTKTNWRYDGVIPNIETKSKDALNKAHIHALESLIEREKNEEFKIELKNIYKDKIAVKEEAKENFQSHEFAKYVGTYEGGRFVFVEDNELKYLREGSIPLTLKYQEDHLYKITLPANARSTQPVPSVRFNLGVSGDVESLTLVFENDTLAQGPFKKEIK